MAELADRFEREHLPRKRPGTKIAYKRTLNRHIRPHFGRHAKVADVGFADIDALHRRVTAAGGPYAANRTIRIMSKMFTLAIRWNMRSDNPVKGIELNAETKRKRYLSADELARLVEVLAGAAHKQSVNIIRLLLLTGARKGEVFSMRWDDVDLSSGIWTKLGSTTKQKTDHVVPLSAPALQLLRDIRAQQAGRLGEFVFPSDSTTGHVVDIKGFWDMVCRDAGITNLRPHDLRHSFASEVASGGGSLPLIGALLGHSDPATTARYAHLFQGPQRAAAEKVGAVVVAAGKRGG
jgi:integrase